MAPGLVDLGFVGLMLGGLVVILCLLFCYWTCIKQVLNFVRSQCIVVHDQTGFTKSDNTWSHHMDVDLLARCGSSECQAILWIISRVHF